MKTEFRFCELRREGRTLSGRGVVYGDVANVGGRPERFLPGAFGANVSKLDVILNAAHDRARPLARSDGGGLVLTDTPAALEVVARRWPKPESLPTPWRLIEAGVLRGLSLEFVATRESMVGPTRVLAAARLVGIAVVDKPAYSASKVAARAEVDLPARWELIL